MYFAINILAALSSVVADRQLLRNVYSFKETHNHASVYKQIAHTYGFK